VQQFFITISEILNALISLFVILLNLSRLFHFQIDLNRSPVVCAEILLKFITGWSLKVITTSFDLSRHDQVAVFIVEVTTVYLHGT
jgi:hypothetical protein